MLSQQGRAIGANTGTDAVQRSIPAKLERLENAVANLNEELGYLATAIEPVLSPLPPQAVGDNAKVPHSGCSLAHKLNSLADSVQLITSCVNQLRSRVEI